MTACQMVAATVMLALPFNTLLMSLVFYLVGKWPGEGRGPLRCVFHAEVSSMGLNGGIPNIDDLEWTIRK